MDSTSLLSAQLPLLLCLAVAVTGGLIAAIFLHRQRAAHAIAMQRVAGRAHVSLVSVPSTGIIAAIAVPVSGSTR